MNYPSSHKEILAVKKTVNNFKLFLKPVKFIIRTDLKIMPGIFKNENLMAENSSRILKWFSWLSSFDYEIVYKPGYLNCLADMLTRESAQHQPKELKMFSAGENSSGAGNEDLDPPRDPTKGKAPMTEAAMRREVRTRLNLENPEADEAIKTTWQIVQEERERARKPKTPEELIQKEGLFILPWDNNFPKEVRIDSLEFASTDEAKIFLQLTLVQNIQTSPCKLQILERWEKDAFQSFADAYPNISECRELWVGEDNNGEKYVDLCDGRLTWTSYNLILQYCRERGSIIICADPVDLAFNQTWSGWTDVFLDTFCPRNDWENWCENFILHLKSDLEVAHQNF